MAVNDEFDLGDPLGLGEEVVAAPPKKGSKKAAAPPAPPVEKFIDPEDDRENWPTIRLEPEEGKPNYEFFSVHGTKQNGEVFGHELQVMRDVDVKVPPSVVYALQDTIAAHYSQRIDPTTGKMSLARQNRSSIPWRLVKGGKYC